MIRFWVPLIVVALIAPNCRGEKYAPISLPELVCQADVIVVGTIVAATDVFRVKVSEKLSGHARSEITFPRHRDTFLRPGDSRLLFLVSDKQGLNLVHPLSYEPASKVDDVRRLLDIKAGPDKYFDDPKISRSAEYLEILGWVFQNSERVGKLAKADIVQHLESSLLSTEKQVVLQALAALKRTGSKQAALSVIPLLRHSEVGVRCVAADFLGWSRDRRAVRALCDALDDAAPKVEFANVLCRALVDLRDSAAVPPLRRAIQRGAEGPAFFALGRVGTEKDAELLLNGVVTKDSMDAGQGLQQLVLRSNKPLEPWMDKGWSPQTGYSAKLDWLKWWEANKATFKVTKTADEKFGPNK